MKQLPRVNIAHLPTPIERLAQLSDKLGGPQIFVKRDDLTGLAFGGNKTRKLEFLVAEALAGGAKTLITTGAAQSNHCRQTAAAAARYGLDCILILRGQPDQVHTGNILLDHLFGAQIVWVTQSEPDALLQHTYHLAREEGKCPYLVPYGGSNATGAFAYALAIREMLEQGFHPDRIIFASSSGGTQAGMVFGSRLFGFKGQVLGISVDRRQKELCSDVASLATATANHLGVSEVFTADEILVDDNYLGGGYGVMGEQEKEAIHLFARLEGLLLDPVYTGRAGAGLIDLIRKGNFRNNEQLLFWHTGGTPALFAQKYQGLVS